MPAATWRLVVTFLDDAGRAMFLTRDRHFATFRAHVPFARRMLDA